MYPFKPFIYSLKTNMLIYGISFARAWWEFLEKISSLASKTCLFELA